MAQSDKSEWFTTDIDLECVYNDLLAESNQTTNSDFILTVESFTRTVGLRVFSCVENIEPLFVDTYPKRTISDSANTNVFHLNNVSRKLFSLRYPNIDFKNKPAVTMFNNKTWELLVVEFWDFDYGFTNTMILGLFSYIFYEKYDFKYAHAACLEIDGNWTLIVWDQWTGKSTLFSKLLEKSIFEPNMIGIITDDWVIIQDLRNWFLVQRLSEEYRIELQMIWPEKNIFWEDFKYAIRKIDAPIKAKKVTIPIDALCSGLSFKSLRSTTCNRIIVIDPLQQKSIEEPTQQRVLDIIRKSTFNVPPWDHSFKHALTKYWAEKLNEMEVIKINPMSSSASLKDIIELILDN